MLIGATTDGMQVIQHGASGICLSKAIILSKISMLV
jgi:hypothetical protein